MLLKWYILHQVTYGFYSIPLENSIPKFSSKKKPEKRHQMKRNCVRCFIGGNIDDDGDDDGNGNYFSVTQNANAFYQVQ